MSMHYKYQRMAYRLRRGIWTEGNVPLDRKHWMTYIAQRLYIALHGLFLKEHWMSAAQLTFNTLMAIIPVFAIVYAIASGFGFGDLIVSDVQKAFSSQPKIADAIVTLANNYIHYTHTGVVLGISFVFMLYSVLSLFNNIEIVFNHIWGTSTERSFGRTIVDYTSMLFIVPVCIILFSGLSIFFYSLIAYIPSWQVLTPFVRGTVQFLAPLVLLTLFFMAAYTGIPNTNVKLKYVMVPSLLAAVCIILLQMVYVHFQILFTGYSIIYGSLAALPLLMLWLQISWFIAIGFAELAHANQEVGRGNLFIDKDENIDSQIGQCAVILNLMCQRQKRGSAPMTMKDLIAETHVSYYSLRKSLEVLQRARLIYGGLSKKDNGTDVFVLSREGISMKFGELYDAFMGLPHDGSSKKKPWQIKEHVKERLRGMRKDYIDSLNAIAIRDCAEKTL